jgi:2-hydroxy-6-oxonona-2,4-dienedioate hydrolase
VTDALTQESTSRFIETKKWRIHYNEAGTGHPVILLHGSGPGASGWSNFSPNLGALGERFHAMALDMPGWGESDTVTFEERDHSEALLLFLDSLEIERATIVGNSMGGMTAIRFAVDHPDRMSHLVTMGAPFPGAIAMSPGGGPSEGLAALQAAYIDPSPENFTRLVGVMAFDARFATPELAAERSRNALARPDHIDNFVKGMRGGVPGFFGLAPELAKVELPTLIFHGRDDRTISFEHALHNVAIIKNSRLVLFNRCGHWVQLEHADEFNRMLTDFVLHN